MKTDLKKLPQSQISLTITIEPEEYKKYIDGAVRRIKEHIDIKGFRKGHAPEEEVIKKAGIMTIYEQAIQRIIPVFFVQASKEHNLETVGPPEVNVEKLAPDNQIVFTVKTSLLPKVTLPNLEKVTVEKKPVVISEERIEEVLKEIQKGRAQEIISSEAAGKADKVVVDMHMLKGGVPVDGGDAMNYGIYLDEDHYVPGMTGKLVGVKKGEEKEFTLTFPDDHYQKHLAGKDIDFKIAVKDVYKRELVPIDEAFAKGLGQESLEKLRALIKDNLTQEAQQKEEQRFEAAALEELIKQTTFGELPEVIVKAEKEKMFFELKRSLEHAGIEMKKYLEDLKKTEEDLAREWTGEAEKRAKASLLSRQFAKENKIEVTPEEIEEEKKLIRQHYKDNQEIEKQLEDPAVMQSMATVIQNRKVMKLLVERLGA